MTRAAVGTQPFGGEGLSGAGPNAGGPNYVRRFAVERTVTINPTAAGGNASLLMGAVEGGWVGLGFSCSWFALHIQLLPAT